MGTVTMTPTTEGSGTSITDPLTARIQDFENGKQRSLGEYIREGQKRKLNQDQCLYSFHGWKSSEDSLQKSLFEEVPLPSGGYYIRWNNQGIVINPTQGFLKTFHAEGFHIRDIDHVIITESGLKCRQDIKAIHNLNAEVNKLSTQLHSIQYYLSPEAFRDLFGTLKPHFKQERQTVHSMELFADSPDLESYELAPSIKLFYFPVSNNSRVGIRLDLGSEMRLGYVTGCSWTPQLTHHLSSCDLLICGLGKTSFHDYDKVHYNNDSLGFFGCSTLIEEAKPRLCFLSELEGNHGDLRLELTKRLRAETSHLSTTVLPCDRTLRFNLEKHLIQCSITQKWVSPEEVRVFSLEKAFGKLRYLSEDIIL